MSRPCIWSDDEVKEWAIYFIDLGFTIEELEILLEVPHSTISWCWMHRLPHIDGPLYDKVRELILQHLDELPGKMIEGRWKKREQTNEILQQSAGESSCKSREW